MATHGLDDMMMHHPNGEDDLYEDFTPQSIFSSHSFPPPSTSGFGRLPTAFAPPDTARPMTAVRAAGFTSRISAGTTNTFDPLNQAGREPGGLQTEPESAEEICIQMEKEVSNMVEESATASFDGRVKEALAKAKEALRKENLLTRHRESNAIAEPLTVPFLPFIVYFNLAQQLERTGQDDEALRTYTFVVRKSKEYIQCARIRVNMGNIYFRQRKYLQAIKMYKMALDHIPNSAKALRYKIMRNVGHAHVALKQFDQAVQNYEALLEEHRDVPSAYNLVLCRRAMGEKEAIKDAFGRLLQADPEEVPSEDMEERPQENDDLAAELRARRELTEECIVTAAKTIAPMLEDGDIMAGFDYVINTLRHSRFMHLAEHLEMTKALELLKKRDCEKALEVLKGFEQKDENLAQRAYCNLSFVYHLEGDIPQAERYARMAVKRDQYNASALVNLGNCHYANENYEEARDMYERALSSRADCMEALYNLGLVCLRLEDPEESLAAFEKLHKQFPNNTDVMFQLAKANEHMNRPRQAAKYLSLITTRIPSDGQVLWHLGTLCAQYVDESQALHYHLEAYRYDPTSIDIVAWLGAYFVKCEMFEKAIGYFRRAAQIDPSETKWMLLVAMCYRRLSMLEYALHIYQDVHEKHPNNAECLRYLKHVSMQLNMLNLVQEYEKKLNTLESEANAERERLAHASVQSATRKRRSAVRRSAQPSAGRRARGSAQRKPKKPLDPLADLEDGLTAQESHVIEPEPAIQELPSDRSDAPSPPPPIDEDLGEPVREARNARPAVGFAHTHRVTKHAPVSRQKMMEDDSDSDLDDNLLPL
eukprot:gnl/Trimastix_PCT/1504.p1 GENE.gnl/Trimastix_PCT/1504~~gnl/Trimastix_PCT/1504.p1  ORF type:complete len:821 (-),score=245.28 gnl/Trimastix_PCT/1504:58-2520(-)